MLYRNHPRGLQVAVRFGATVAADRTIASASRGGVAGLATSVTRVADAKVYRNERAPLGLSNEVTSEAIMTDDRKHERREDPDPAEIEVDEANELFGGPSTESLESAE